jgi:hypothetical protein
MILQRHGTRRKKLSVLDGTLPVNRGHAIADAAKEAAGALLSDGRRLRRASNPQVFATSGSIIGSPQRDRGDREKKRRDAPKRGR